MLRKHGHKLKEIQQNVLWKVHRVGIWNMDEYKWVYGAVCRHNVDRLNKMSNDKISIDIMPNRQNVDRQNACDPMHVKH